MRLTDASVAIRPRSAWEALDLGVLLARRHAGLLMASWALITLPVLALLTLLLWEYPSWAMFAFWLLKPAYERLPLYILSRALFGDTPSLGQALRAFPRLLRPQLIASLTWRRLSPTRSFDLPVLQLEGLSGAARNQRLVVLGQRDTGAASWLTIVGVHLEMALWLGLVTALYMLLPQQMSIDLDWQKLISPDAGSWLWLDHLSNLLYALALIVWEPVYVACGFSLYLNRRTALEAWDIELIFRRIRQRLGGVAYALLIGLGLLLVQPMERSWAQDASAAICPLPEADPLGPDADRLQQQTLTSKASREAIGQLLDAPPFENRQTVTRWRFGDDPQKEVDGGDVESLAQLLRGLFHLAEFWKRIDGIALLFEVLLWASIFGLIGLLLWRYREWLTLFATRHERRQDLAQERPAVLFGLQVTPESLPDDIPGSVERLWDEQPREALGLLYRALLSRLLGEFRLPLKGAHTEGEVLQLVEELYQDDLSAYANRLTRHWQNLAYGHRTPPPASRDELCQGWRQLFGHGVSR
ncbi:MULTISPECIES: DUF4129 domain-containing protein [Pseudomonas]|uniref:DUF4129 domain-containing protein n=1 Tax=Pseudomonas TaxID=286 RepID=UPI00257C1195|nr:MULTISPECIES: DUF4129 domain-containing protein [Pseudomonas]